ncbi:hypothetical protein C8R44DRAFT_809329 [Mycena epipterygia]|nr:hypothetical protein C8R44DRAFT_809329 [Mycena epipterygia]
MFIRLPTALIVITAILAGNTFAQCADLCCNSEEPAGSAPASTLISLLGIPNVDPTSLVGLGCSPNSGGSCPGPILCCTNNNFNGLIATGCS